MRSLLLLAGFLLNCHAYALDNGDMSPECTLQNIEATQVQISELNQDKVLYVDFWASWCPPCAKSFPFMNQLQARYSAQGLKIIALNLDQKRSDADDFLQRMPAHFEVLFDADGQCAQSFDVQAMPSSYIIDHNGVIRHVHLGFRSGEADEIEQAIQELLAVDSGQKAESMQVNHQDHAFHSNGPSN